MRKLHVERYNPWSTSSESTAGEAVLEFCHGKRTEPECCKWKALSKSLLNVKFSVLLRCTSERVITLKHTKSHEKPSSTTKNYVKMREQIKSTQKCSQVVWKVLNSESWSFFKSISPFQSKSWQTAKILLRHKQMFKKCTLCLEKGNRKERYVLTR